MSATSPSRGRIVSYILAGFAGGVLVTFLLLLAVGANLGPVHNATNPPQSTSSSCPSDTVASVGGGNSTSSPVMSGSTSLHSHAWAEGATPVVVTPGIAIAPGSLLLVFVGYVGEFIGGPEGAAVCDSVGDHFLLQTSTSAYSSNHSEVLFVATDAAGGNVVSFAASFSDTAAEAGGTIAVLDVTSSTTLSLSDLVAVSNTGSSSTGEVNVSVSQPSLLVLGIAGQGDDGPFGAWGTETLLDTAPYYDTGPWTDGEAFGTFVEAAPGGASTSGANLNSAGVWDAIAVAVT
jgi:hypothetical protein